MSAGTCKRGHVWAGDNLYINPSGKRSCRACRRDLRVAGGSTDRRLMTHRYPLEPVYAAAGTDSPCSLAERVGINHRQVHRWRAEGGLTLFAADRVACALNVHPLLLWPEWGEVVVDLEAEEQFALLGIEDV